MIFTESKLQIADNSGGLIAKCIKTLKSSSQKKGSKLGDIIIITVFSAQPHKKIKKKQIYRALIIRSKQLNKRFDGSYINFDNNSCILLNNKLSPIGKRIKGPCSYEASLFNDRKLKSMIRSTIF